MNVNTFDQAYQYVINNHAQELERLMKKKIALVSFMSNGGWYLLGGDEFGDPGMYGQNIRQDNRKCTKLVFSSHDTERSFIHNTQHPYDLRDFISNINTALGSLTPPEVGDWMEYIPLKLQPNLVVIIRHSGMNCDIGSSQLLLVNVSNENETLHNGIIKYIQSNRGQCERRCPLLAIQQSIVVGNITIEASLNNPIILNNIPFHSAPTGTPSTTLS